MNNSIKKKIVATIVVIVISSDIILFGAQIPKEMYWAIGYHLENNRDMSFNGKINSVVNAIRDYSNLKRTFHINNVNLWIDIWGYIQKKTGIIYYPGIDQDMVYLDNGHLTFFGAASCETLSSEISSGAYRKYKEVYQYLSGQNIEFLQIVFPIHLHQKTVLPYGLKNNTNQIYTQRIKLLKENGIPVIDARDLYKDMPDVHYQLSYKGDHHWKPEYAYRVYIYISQELEKLRSPMAKYFDRTNMQWNDYYIENRQPPFQSILGSAERRVGRFFLPQRDITPYMIPRYETNYTFQVPSKEINKTGSVNDTFLDFFNDVPIEIIINNQIANNKIMVFHDSFIHSFAPFLATNNHYLYMIDMRHYHGDIIDLIEQEKPDAIIFAYSFWPLSHIELFDQQIQEKQKLNKTSRKD